MELTDEQVKKIRELLKEMKIELDGAKTDIAKIQEIKTKLLAA